MSIPVISNRYSFPLGYRHVGTPVFPAPWNGFLSGTNSPQATILGAVLQIVTSAAPADLSTFSFGGPDGKQYLFQFVYNASVQTLGIKIPLPLSGASTAAQVMTQIAGVLSLPTGVIIGGGIAVFPWNFQTINGTTSRINFNYPGPVGSTSVPTGVALTIIAPTSVAALSSTSPVPGKVGPLGAFLQG